MALLACRPAGAATFWWDTTTTGLWSSSANWWTTAAGTTNGGPPGLNDVATFNGDGVTGTTVAQLDAATSLGGVGGLAFVNTGSTRIESSSATSQALTLGSGGITVAATAGDVTIGSASNPVTITLDANQPWTNNSASLLTVVNNVSNAANTLTVNGSGSTTISGVLGNGSGGLVKRGASTLTLSASNSYSGGTTVEGGILRLNNTGAAGSGAVALAGGTLSLIRTSATTTYTTAISVASGQTGSLRVDGSGSNAATNGNNSWYTVGTITVDGVLTVSRPTGGTGSTIFNGQLVGSGTLVVDNTNGGVAPVSGTTTGSQLGRGQFQRTDNTFNGSVVIQNGGNFQNSTQNPSYASVEIGANSFFTLVTNFASSTTSVNTLTGSGTVLKNNNTGYTSTLSVAAGDFGGVISSGTSFTGSGTIALQKTGVGTLRLSGANTYTGPTTVTGGTLQIGNGGTTGSLSTSSAITVASGATLAFFRTNTINQGTDFNSVISGAGGVAQLGSGTLALTGVNTYSGQTRVSAGVLAVGVNGSFANSTEIKVGDAGSSAAVLDLTAKTSGFTFGSGQAVSGIGTINIGTGVNVTSNGIWAPGNSIGSNAVTGNLTLSGTSQFELGTPGASTTAPGNADFTAVSGTLTLGGNLVLLNNSGSNSLGSYGAGSYRLFTAPTVSSTFASVTAPAGATTTRVAMVYGSGTSSGQGVFANVYNLAVGSVTSGTSVDLGLIHAGGSFTAQSLSIGNTAAAGSFSEGLNASVTGSTGNATSGGTAITNLVAGGTLSTITVNLADTATGGVKNGTLTIGYQSNGSTTSGLATVSAGSQVVNLAGSVFSGSATWNVNGGGSWGALASGTSWTSAGGIKAAPGTFVGYTNTDSATFGNALTSGMGTILLNGATPSLASLVFSNTTSRYVIDQGSGGSLTLAAASGKPTIDVISSGLHEIKTAILGTSGLQKTGLGSLVLSGSSTYSGGTDITAGTLAVNGFLGGAVNVANGAILGGSGTLNGPVTVAAGGILAPGNSPGTLTMDSGLVLDAASILNFELNAANTTIGGGFNDLIVVTGTFTLDGILNVSGTGDFSTVADNTKWRLFNYSGGTFTNGGLSLGSMPSVGASGKYFQIDTATAGQVNLVIVPEPEALALAGVGIAAAVWAARRRK